MCLRISSDVIESSDGLSSAGMFAACAAGDAEAFADVLVGVWVVVQAHAAASRKASAKEIAKRLFIVCFASLFGTGMFESFAAAPLEVNSAEDRILRNV